MSELVDVIAAEENDCEIAELTGKERQRVYTALYQSHLPNLDDHDVLTFSRETKIVGVGPAFYTVYAVLQRSVNALVEAGEDEERAGTEIERL